MRTRLRIFSQLIEAVIVVAQSAIGYRRVAILAIGIMLLNACGGLDAPRSPATAATDTAPVPTAVAVTQAPRLISSVAPAQATATYVPMQVVATMEATFAPLVVTADMTPTVTIIPLIIKEQVLQVELASTNEQRNHGYMGRTSIPDGTGMLFVFANDQQLNFWMRDTPTALSIAFVDAQKQILNIADMQPFDDRTIHKSVGLARYALEVPQGWFTTHGIQGGDVLEFSLPEGIVIE